MVPQSCSDLKVTEPGAMAEEFTLSSTVAAGSAVIVSALSPKAGNWYGPAPSLPGRLKPRPGGSSRIETSSQVRRELGVGYSTLRRLLEREIDEEALGFIHTTNGFTEGCHTKIKMLKWVSYGWKNVEVYWRKCSWGLCHLEAISTQY
jgi:hypothetical protein